MLSTEKVDGTVAEESERTCWRKREAEGLPEDRHVNGSSQRPARVWGDRHRWQRGVVRSPGKPSQKGGEFRTVFPRMNEWAATVGRTSATASMQRAPVEGTEV